MFQFVLPPPPPPEDSPSPSSNSSYGATRHRSPSLDIETVSPPSSQPPNSPPPIEHKLPSPPPEPNIKSETPSQPQLPNSNSIGKSLKAGSNNSSSVKKRKKGDVDPVPIIQRPKPEDMPPKPPFTYAQLIYKAIKAIDGKATLQEICTWISQTYDYYKYADGAWMVRSHFVFPIASVVVMNEQSSVRHNLSSGRAFLKMERCGGDRGKGFFWSIDEKHAQAFEEQDAKMRQAAASGGCGKDGVSKGKKKDKGTSLLEPPLKRSVKGDTKGLPLPPPLTNTPLSFKTTASSSSLGLNGTSGASNAITSTAPPTTGIFAYPAHPQSSHTVTVKHGSTVTPSFSGSNPYAALTQTPWGVHRPTSGTITEVSATSTASTSGDPLRPLASTQSSTPTPQAQQPTVPDVVIPIVLGPIPETHPDYSPSHRNNSAKEGYMILHERKLILDPDVFTGLTPEMLTELERMGARAALGVLTGHMVRALKEKRAREREKNKDKGAKRSRGPRGSRKGAGSKSSEPPGSPFTKAPLEKRDVGSAETETINGKLNGSMSQSTPGTHSQDGNPIAPPADPGSPIIVVVDSDDEGPAMKKRKVDDESQEASNMMMVTETSSGLIPMVL